VVVGKGKVPRNEDFCRWGLKVGREYGIICGVLFKKRNERDMRDMGKRSGSCGSLLGWVTGGLRVPPPPPPPPTTGEKGLGLSAAVSFLLNLKKIKEKGK
jgi:hypothetical protein